MTVNRFRFDIRRLLLVLALVVVPLMALNMRQESDDIPLVLRPFHFVAGLAQRGFATFSAGIRGTTSMYLDLLNVKTENRTLRAEIGELRAKLGAMNELKIENERLNQLLGFQQSTPMQMVAARVIGKDLLPDHHTLTVNRGTEHGLKKGMAAITVGGVVGYVFRAEAHSASVLLLTDRYAAIDAVIQRSRARGIVEGNGRHGAAMKYLRRLDSVQAGDLIVTSGMYGIFPKGFPIGTVNSVRKSQYGMTQEVDLQPAVETQDIEELFVVLNTHNADFSPPPAQNPVEPETQAPTKQ